MTRIKSDSSIAQSHVTGVTSALSQLSAVATVAKDESTTVAGNAKAHAVIDLAGQGAQSLSSAIASVMTNLESVTAGFEETDAAQAGNIQNL